MGKKEEVSFQEQSYDEESFGSTEHLLRFPLDVEIRRCANFSRSDAVGTQASVTTRNAFLSIMPKMIHIGCRWKSLLLQRSVFAADRLSMSSYHPGHIGALTTYREGVFSSWSVLSSDLSTGRNWQTI